MNRGWRSFNQVEHESCSNNLIFLYLFIIFIVNKFELQSNSYVIQRKYLIKFNMCINESSSNEFFTIKSNWLSNNFLFDFELGYHGPSMIWAITGLHIFMVWALIHNSSWAAKFLSSFSSFLISGNLRLYKVQTA